MKRLGILGGLVLAVGLGYLIRGATLPEPSPVMALDEPTAAPGPSEPEPGPTGTVWVALEFVDQENGLGTEYLGRADADRLAAVLDGEVDAGYLELRDVFWLYDDGEVERLDDDLAYRDVAYFQIESIRRVTLLKDGFPEAARQIPSGDRVIPGPGHDA